MNTRYTQKQSPLRMTTLALVALGITVAGCEIVQEASQEVHHVRITAHGDQAAPIPGHYRSPIEAEAEDSNEYFDHGENDRISTALERVSTFSVDVNNASYTMARSALNAGRLPDPASVRAEEFINFFTYDYPAPTDGPFSIHTEVAPSYFGSHDDVERHLMKIGMQAREVAIDDMQHNNLVFLIDVSGSMRPEVRLPLAKRALHILLENLRPTDTVAIQTYASGTETLLEPTPVSDFHTIDQAIQSLVAEGGTFGEGGIRAAYDMAERAFVEGGNNRVIILTDGDFNVGKRGDDIVEIVKGFREREIALTSVGFGHGNHQDHTMERLAREGNGNYFYIDTIEEAQRIFGTDLPSTLEIIASDVRVQVEFNDDAVKSYRLIGYEKRVLDNEAFEDESTNAAEVGPGHNITAFYEVELHDGAVDLHESLAQIRIRYKEELLGHSLEVVESVHTEDIHRDFDHASSQFRFAAAVAEFASALRHSEHVQGARFEEIHRVASDARLPHESARQFLELVTIANDLWE